MIYYSDPVPPIAERFLVLAARAYEFFFGWRGNGR